MLRVQNVVRGAFIVRKSGKDKWKETTKDGLNMD